MWISSGGSQSHLHMDTVDNINCIVSGFKKWFVVDQVEFLQYHFFKFTLLPRNCDKFFCILAKMCKINN